MRVLLDATAIPVDRRGVGRYLEELIPALARTDGLALVVAAQAHDAEAFGRTGAEVVAASGRIASRRNRMVWEQTTLPALARRVGAQVVHSPHYTMPLACRVPVVVTLHDATFFSNPDLHQPLKRHFFRAATRLAVRRAAALVVPSAATRDELVRLVSPAAARAVVAHHGVDSATFHRPSDAEIEQLRRDLDLGSQDYVAFLGTIEPRKNLVNLVRGWQQAASGRDRAPAMVLAGGRGWDAEIDDAVAAVTRSAPSLRLLRPGYLPVESLRALLGGAEVVAYPALGEGFGLPVLEAMACGTAVLTTRRLALPEVGGDAVAYTETDAASIAAALTGLLDDPGRRLQLAAAGIARAAEFTWDRAAQAHLHAFRTALSR
ncbi:glycosyltransferase family 4 protein [Jatrophihabitans telluris]|uniref:glycosyltransferase family 4 protein n=1 Tax=Jatrophihabitans telluris TaxID=2038343 RepID=UPI003221C315